jgi:hypothetical protein
MIHIMEQKFGNGLRVQAVEIKFLHNIKKQTRSDKI